MQATLEGVALDLRWAMSKVARQKGVRRHDLPLPLVDGAAVNPASPNCSQMALDRRVEGARAITNAGDARSRRHAPVQRSAEDSTAFRRRRRALSSGSRDL
ncbi:MAG: hypothetical protein HPM95_05195 [Alphaproteobacteria bacterium]|nr:hypothetical protein [Alphaproteobacteria bacterium]